MKRESSVARFDKSFLSPLLDSVGNGRYISPLAKVHGLDILRSAWTYLNRTTGDASDYDANILIHNLIKSSLRGY